MLAVLRMWAGDPYEPPRPFQQIHMIKTIFTITLRCHLPVSPSLLGM